jgi:hypothetical protein
MEFTCDACGGTFTSEWSDEDAQTEAALAFDPAELEGAAVVCDDCFQDMRAVMPDMDARYRVN